MGRRLFALIALGALLAVGFGVVALRGGAATATTAAAPSFTRDVAPIMREKCAGCHRLGGIAPFAFSTAHDVTSRASLVADAVQTRRMPPWPPGRASQPITGQDARTLTETERTTLLRWLRTGARVDGTKIGQPPRAKPTTRPGETVRTLALPTAYQPKATGTATDDYRCFLVDPKLTEDAFVTAARIEPGATAEVHHVILFRVPPAGVPAAEALDAQTPEQGWTCFGGTGIPTTGRDAQNQLNNAPWIAAWAPGGGANRLPDGVGVRLDAGSRVVMQVHYNLLNGKRPDRSRAVLTTAPASAGLTPLETVLLPAPVELPCTTREEGKLCNRTDALFGQVAKYGQEAALIPVGLLFLCGKNQQQPPAGPTTFCDRTIDQRTTIYSSAGHMHLLGRSVRVTLNPGTPREKVVLDIPRWDFHWQASYLLQAPIVAEAGDVLRVTCTHDASLRAEATNAVARKPRYVLWGEGTTDEMCLGIVQVTRG